MNENAIQNEESIVPIIIATAVVTVAAVVAVKGLWGFVEMVRKGNSIKKAARAEVIAEESN